VKCALPELPKYLVLLAAALAIPPVGAAQHVWQADLQIKSLTVSQPNGKLTARFVVTADIGEAMAPTVEVMLPPGVGILEMGPGCRPGANPPGVSVLRARVLCTVGNLASRMSRELYVIASSPPANASTEFGVIALSDTPDPRPGNNFAQRKVP